MSHQIAPRRGSPFVFKSMVRTCVQTCLVTLFLFTSTLWSVAEDSKEKSSQNIVPTNELLQMLEKIQNQWLKRNPGLWISDLYAYDIIWNEKLTGLRSPVKYERRIRKTPDKQYLVAENWSINPGDLTPFMSHWGHTGVKDWEQIHVKSGENQIFAAPTTGMITIWRFYPSFDQAWKAHSYSLTSLSAEELEPYSADKKYKKGKQFLSDVLLEEILDRDGLGVSLSKTWNFKDHFSRVSTKLRFQRRIRLNTNGLYSVFDTYHLGGEILLGNVIEETQDKFYSEIGPFLGLSKEIIIVQSGYKSWNKALFASPFNPKNLPYNHEKLCALPDGIRIIFPHKATLALVMKTKFNYFQDSDLTQKLRAGTSIRGSVMVSITKENAHTIILKIGGRMEKLLDAYFDMHPDFDGNFDPLRLLFGSIVRMRYEGGRGKRVLLEKRIDLNSDDEVRLLRHAMKHGMLLKGLGFGLRTAIYFIFHPNNEKPYEYFQAKIPEIDWDQAIIGTYHFRDNYLKIGSRPIAFRRGTEAIGDEWDILDNKTNQLITGYTFAIHSNQNKRAISRSRSRDLQLHGITSNSYNEDDFATLIDITRDASWTEKRLAAFKKKWQDCLQINLDLPAELRQNIIGHYARIGYRLIISIDELTSLYQDGTLEYLLKAETPLYQWCKKHKVLTQNFKRALRKENRFQLARTLYKMIKKGAPIHPLLEIMPKSKYKLEWVIENSARETLFRQQQGHAEMSRAQVKKWLWWEEKRMFEEIFVDVSLTAE